MSRAGDRRPFDIISTRTNEVIGTTWASSAEEALTNIHDEEPDAVVREQSAPVAPPAGAYPLQPTPTLVDTARYEAVHGSAITCSGLVKNLADEVERLTRDLAAAQAQNDRLRANYATSLRLATELIDDEMARRTAAETRAQELERSLAGVGATALRAMEERDAAAARAAALQVDAERWQVIKPGLFIAAVDEETGEIEVVYQSGWMDEIAADLRPSLTAHPTAPVFDCADAIADAARVARAAERAADGAADGAAPGERAGGGDRSTP